MRKASIKSRECVQKGQGLSVSGNQQGRKMHRNWIGRHCEEGHPRPRSQLLSHDHCGYHGWPHARLCARHYPPSVTGSSEQPTEVAASPTPSFRISKLKLQGVKPLAPRSQVSSRTQALNSGLFEARAPALRLMYHFQRTFKFVIPSDLPVPEVSLCLTSLLAQMSHPTRNSMNFTCSAPPPPLAGPGSLATCKASRPLGEGPQGLSAVTFFSTAPPFKFTAQ